jgi:hypothetical protein
MTWTPYLDHFEENARRPLPFLPEGLPEVPTAQRKPLAATLARFQLGESGGRRIVTQIDEQPLPASDDQHRAALRMFLREEGRHAHILAMLVRGLGGSLLTHNWGRGAFRLGRNLFGLREKLLVLNVAEVIGIACYGLVAAALPAGPTRTALAQIAADEEQHLLFHSALFAQQHRRGWFRFLWWSVGLIACASVIVDHGAHLAALGIPRRRLWRALLERMRQGDRLMSPTAMLTPARSS